MRACFSPSFVPNMESNLGDPAGEASWSVSAAVKTNPEPQTPAELYLDLLKRALTRALVARGYERHTIWPSRHWLRALARLVRSILTPLHLELVRVLRSEPQDYLESGHAARNRVEDAETMLGVRQLDQMQACINDVIDRGIPGDVLEAGVWRGGMTIFMRAVLKSRGDAQRRVWVADSFAGLPKPLAAFDSFGWNAGDMAVGLEEVRGNFARYGMLDDQVVFLKGFFANTLPDAPIVTLSVLRVDADLYESTRDVLENLYPRLSAGGYAVLDDYRNLVDCRRAVDEYRKKHGIADPIVSIDTRAVYWVKSR